MDRIGSLWLVGGLCVLVEGCYGHTVLPRRTPGLSQALPTVVKIAGGAFTMGDMTGDPTEHPERRVHLSTFYIEKYEVTNAAYRECVRATACTETAEMDSSELGADGLPVVGVSWFDAHTYCQWVGRRLPTEAEWEYAARGRDLRKWPWEGAFDPTNANTRDPLDTFPRTAPVGSFAGGESPFGVMDMAGNVAEWVSDYFDPIAYQQTEAELANPQGPISGRDRVVRGGSWADGPHRVRTTYRSTKSPTEVDNSTGFRCVASGSGN